jgi:tellurite resistance protein
MRSYPRNSPEAAARIVALVLISDGHVCSSEIEALNQLDAAHDFGLEPRDFPGIVQTLCEDLLMDGFDGGSILAHVDDGSLASLMSEVDKPELQGKVLRVAAAAANADKHLSDGEASVLGAISRHWGAGPVMAAGNAAVAGHQRR